MERAPSAGKPRVFRALLGMGEGISPSRFPRHWPPGGRLRGRSGPAGKRREIFFRVLKEVPLAAGPGLGWSPRGRKFLGPVACVTAGWDRGADQWGGAATPGPGAGRRWLPLAPLLAGRRWRRLHPRPRRRRGGGLRGWGVSCIPARSPRRGRGGRRRRGRSRSARSATSHEQRPRERPRCRWPPLSPAGGRLAAPQHPSQPALSRPEVRAGTAEGWDGEGRPAEDRRLGPLGALGP